MDIIAKMESIRIVPVLVLNDLKEGLQVCEQLCRCGLPAAEITFRTAAAEDVIREASKEFPEMFIGAGTVLNVRKSMWIHPTLDRAVSIREAARLQTFPDSYVFCGTKDAQYQQIGNAVPPILGRAIAEKILSLLNVKER